ncbi:MAG: glycoside hydrolase family 125 protein [Clostridia bacterium]|nr:glycoside hydrolase family 125 protein [Clostridia bacterium]
MKLSDVAASYTEKIRDGKIRKMFVQCFMSTFETTVQLHDDGSCFVITGDIPAMWLRDSSAQVNHYIPFAKSSEEAYNVIKGLIHRQMNCILADAYANAFNREANGLGHQKDDTEMTPLVWERKYEIDSLCYPVKLAYRFWKEADTTAHFTEETRQAFYRITDLWTVEQNHENSSYYFSRRRRRKSDTLSHKGKGAPVSYTGMTWSGFRPSDDSCIYGYLVPANMFAYVVLGYMSEIADEVYHDRVLAEKAEKLRAEIKDGIDKYAVVKDKEGKSFYAYETDGRGHFNLMDDANVPSLLSLPYLGYCSADDEIYINTRKFILSKKNPYYYAGRKAKGIGSPHTPKNHIWPIALCMQGLTSDDKNEMLYLIRTLAETDSDTGFMHESFHKNKPQKFTREWFSWANTLYAELIIKYLSLGGEI